MSYATRNAVSPPPPSRMAVSGLDRLTIRDAVPVKDESSGRSVLHVKDSHALIQAAGYLKHVNARHENIYFRGQADLFPTLMPSLFRGVKSDHARGTRIGELHRVIEAASKKAQILRKLHPVFREPLLQHYGLRTTWLDLVDNVWVALWFACHRALVGTKTPRHLHFETRNPDTEQGPSYVYILMLGTDNRRTPMPGLLVGGRTELVDLRLGFPEATHAARGSFQGQRRRKVQARRLHGFCAWGHQG